jgi:hypothetical protein
MNYSCILDNRNHVPTILWDTEFKVNKLCAFLWEVCKDTSRNELFTTYETAELVEQIFIGQIISLIDEQ